MITATRKLEFDSGHRVMRHESKCRNVHGHRYVAEITVSAPELDECDRVVDFSEIKRLVGTWIDDNWDHGFISHSEDRYGKMLASAGELKVFFMPDDYGEPTAENMARYLAEKCDELLTKPLTVEAVRLYETPNCWADWNRR
tara:strand:- start:220 stop:645 length:426 start_codon:yes stop_codon:yes gene_type:complete